MKKWADTKRRPVRHVIDLYDDNRKHESLVAEGKAIKGRNPTESVITTKLEWRPGSSRCAYALVGAHTERVGSLLRAAK